MTRLGARRLRVPWLLLGCAVALAATLGVENMRFRAAPATAQDKPAAAPAADATRVSYEPAPASRYLEIAERPLFVPDRRPQQDAAVRPAAPPPPAPTLLVEGVVLSPEHRYAVIQHGNPPKLDSVAEGAMIDGWKVERIEAGKIALGLGDTVADYPVGKPNAQSPQQMRSPLVRPRVVPAR